MAEVRFTSDEQLDRWCAHHAPGSPAVVAAHEQIRKAARAMMTAVQEVVPEGPDKTVVFRAVRDAMLLANAAIACNHPDNQAARYDGPPPAGTFRVE